MNIRAHDSVVSLQHFSIRQSRNETHKNKRQKSSLYNVSIWRKKITRGKTKKWHSPFCFREVKLDVVLCVKASKFMHTHTRAYSQFLIHRRILSPFWDRWAKERWNVTFAFCQLLLSDFLHVTGRWQQSENSLKQTQWEQQGSIQKKIFT